MNTYFLQGLALGAATGVSPGPMLALVLSAALRGGFKNGALIAIAPLITDLPIILFCVAVASQLPDVALQLLSILGGLVLAWHAYEAVRDAFTVTLAELRDSATGAPPAAQTLRKGIVANFLNPNPWVFWMSIGGPVIVEAWSVGPTNAALYLLPFYALLVGGKVGIAWAVGASRHRMSNRTYQVLLLGAAGLLSVLAVSLVMRGLA